MSNPYANIPPYEDIYGGQYFSPADLHEGPVTAKITALKYDKVFCPKINKEKQLIILTLAGQKKKICVNKTSAKAMAFAFGKDWQAWVGKTIICNGGQVNGKAAVLLTPVVERGAAKPPPSAPPVLERGDLQDDAPPSTLDALDPAKSCRVTFMKCTGSNGDYIFHANDGSKWRADQARYEAIAALKATGKEIGITHFGRQIESVTA